MFGDFFGKSKNGRRRSVNNYFVNPFLGPGHHSDSHFTFQDICCPWMWHYCEGLPTERIDRPNCIGRAQSGIAYDIRYPVLKANRRARFSFNDSNRIRICKVFHCLTQFALKREKATLYDCAKAFKETAASTRTAPDDVHPATSSVGSDASTTNQVALPRFCLLALTYPGQTRP